MSAYYNEIDPHAAQWLRNLISAGLIPDGEVDERSIVDVGPDDLAGFRQCHFFAGIGGWALAARLAGWPDDREIWTGSCPCQPFSVAGQGKAQADDRHLWPHLFRLASARRPAVLMGEQVAAAVGKDWLDGVCFDMESIGYACRGVVVPACAVDAPHRRDRLWFVADAECQGLEGRFSAERDQQRQDGQAVARLLYGEDVPDASLERQPGPGWLGGSGDPEARGDWEVDRVVDAGGSYWGDARFVPCADGKARRLEPGIEPLAYGVPGRMGRLRAYGNAIVTQVAAEVIGAYMDATYEPADLGAGGMD